MKKIAILGITGSIGTSAVEIVRSHPEDFKIVLASSHNNFIKLAGLAAAFKIPHVVLTNNLSTSKLTDLPRGTQLYRGSTVLHQLINDLEIDLVLNAISGSAGLESSIATLRKGTDLALANKESLVLAGHIIQTEQIRSGSRLIPVDSEHSAIFQAIGETPLNEVRSLTLTASGGPFRELPLKQFTEITLEDTLQHPTWDMGNKVTIDSATMMNKGLEVIEAHWLFNKQIEEIEALIHPQSIIHSFVTFVDGSILAQLSFPDMKLPILYALSYPGRIRSDISNTDLSKITTLNFNEIERERYPLYFLARNVGQTGGLLPTIMNAANEAAIELFLKGRIKFIDLVKLILAVTEREANLTEPDLDTIINVNKEINQKVKKEYKNILKN
jgi:1-deoxy-D-xylulose-5-phosphate reductoisomerase